MNSKLKQDQDGEKAATVKKKPKEKETKVKKPLAGQIYDIGMEPSTELIYDDDPYPEYPEYPDDADFIEDGWFTWFTLPDFSNCKKATLAYILCAFCMELSLTIHVIVDNYSAWDEYFNQDFFTIPNIQETVVILGALAVVALAATFFGVWTDNFWPIVVGVIAYMLLAFGLCLSNFLRAQAVTRYLNGGPVILKALKPLPREAVSQAVMIIEGCFSAISFIGLMAVMIFQDFAW